MNLEDSQRATGRTGISDLCGIIAGSAEDTLQVMDVIRYHCFYLALVNHLEFNPRQFCPIFVADGMLSIRNFKIGVDTAQFGGEITQTIIGEDGHDHADIRVAFGNFKGSSNVAAGGDATED